MAAADLHGGKKRSFDPGAQHPAAHRRSGPVQHPEQRPALFPAAERFRQFQISSGGPVHLHISAAGEDVHAADMAEIELLCFLYIGQQRSGGADGGGVFPETAAVCVRIPELRTDPRRAGRVIKALLSRLRHRRELHGKEGRYFGIPLRPGGQHGLFRGESAQFVEDVADRILRECAAAELARGDVAEGGSPGAFLQADRADVIAPRFLQHGALGHGAGCDDPDHIPLHQSLGKGGILRLLADGHLIAFRYELGDIALGGMIGDAAHGGALLRILHAAVPRGQRQIELPGGDLRVVVEHLVEIAQPEKEQTVRVLLFDLVILFFHGCEFSHFPFLRTEPRCCSPLSSHLRTGRSATDLP